MAEQLVLGFHAVESLLRHRPRQIISLQCNTSRRDKRLQRLLDLAANQGVAVTMVERQALDKLSNGQRHQGVVASVSGAAEDTQLIPLATRLAEASEPSLWLVLDQIQDPHNLGACLRTAAACGVDGVILPRDNSATINETVRRVAAGAVERLAIYSVTNLARTLNDMQQQGVWVIGTDGDAENSLYQVNLNASVAIVLGAEGEGMRRLTRQHCDETMRIPMPGDMESLNVSVACGVVLFEANRQRM